MISFPLKFRAAMIERIGGPLVLDEIEFSGPLRAGQALVKLTSSGICGKQIEEIDGTGGPDPFLPHLLGHEGCGEVLAVGEGVVKVRAGDTVVLHWMKGSGINSETPVYRRGASRVNAGWVTTFNEYAVVSENRLTPVPADIDPIAAALFGCVVTTGVGVVLNKADVRQSDTLLISGCGGVGLCAILAARTRQPKKIIAVDVNIRSLRLAEEFGATETIQAGREDVAKRVLDLTGGGATKSIICTGNPQAIMEAVESTSVPGDCYLVGVPPVGSTLSLNAHAIMHERNIHGALGGNTFPDRDIPAYMAMYKEGLLPLSKLIAHVGPFEKINDAVDVMRSDTPGRCMVRFGAREG